MSYQTLWAIVQSRKQPISAVAEVYAWRTISGVSQVQPLNVVKMNTTILITKNLQYMALTIASHSQSSVLAAFIWRAKLQPFEANSWEL